MAARASVHKRNYVVPTDRTTGSAAAAMAMGKVALRKEGEGNGDGDGDVHKRRVQMSKKERLQRVDTRNKIEMEKAAAATGTEAPAK